MVSHAAVGPAAAAVLSHAVAAAPAAGAAVVAADCRCPWLKMILASYRKIIDG